MLSPKADGGSARPPELNAVQADAFREIANIGSGHAAPVLSKLTSLRIMITVPEVSAVPAADLAGRFGNEGRPIAVLAMRMLGDLTGHTFFVMPDDGAKVLADLLLRRLPSSGTLLDELERSSLLEAGNILAGSFLNALADCINGLLLPSVPTLDICEPRAFFDGLGLDPQHDMVILAETEFYVRDDDPDGANPEGDPSSPGPAPKLRGASLFLPDSHSLEHLFASILAVRPRRGR